jgi:radical SAM superfamily enzyme YgiQ (UPF0313 family)
MSSRVLLISANRCTTPDPVFPLGLAFLNAALREAGYDTVWVDRLAAPDSLEETVKSYRPDFIGISLRNIDDVLIRQRETFFDELASLGNQLRRLSTAPIVLGGSGFSIFPRELLELAGADFGITGEGEAGFLELLEALVGGKDYRTLPGLVYRQNGSVTVNPGAANNEYRDLTEADRPAALTAHYLRTSSMLNIQTQRGCRFRCCYCTYPVIEGKQNRRRPPDMVAAEFDLLQRQGARYVFIVDSVFNSSPRHVTEVCEALLRKGVKLNWGCFLRPQGLTADLMQLMKRAGLVHVEFGSDSFCDDVLKAYDKDFTFDEVVRCSRLARDHDIEHCHYLIIGGPGETESTIQEGFRNSERLENAVIMAMVGMRIYPGTRLFERALAEGCIRRETSLLTPAYYIAPGLSQQSVFAMLQDFAGRSPNWIIGDPTPSYLNLTQRLRARGVAGPLWSYLSVVQRLWQPNAPARAL